MPTWLIPTLKWGGITAAFVAAVGILEVVLVPTAAGPEADAISGGAWTLPYWALFAAGIGASIAGFRLDQH
jgi:hypothetical protein